MKVVIRAMSERAALEEAMRLSRDTDPDAPRLAYTVVPSKTEPGRFDVIGVEPMLMVDMLAGREPTLPMFQGHPIRSLFPGGRQSNEQAS